MQETNTADWYRRASAFFAPFFLALRKKGKDRRNVTSRAHLYPQIRDRGTVEDAGDDFEEGVAEALGEVLPVLQAIESFCLVADGAP